MYSFICIGMIKYANGNFNLTLYVWHTLINAT